MFPFIVDPKLQAHAWIYNLSYLANPAFFSQQRLRLLPHQPAPEELPGEGGQEDLQVCRRVLRRERPVRAGLRPGRTEPISEVTPNPLS